MSRILIEKELGATPSVEEMQVVDILVVNRIPKKRIMFLKPSRVKGSKTPDIMIDDDFWEIKSILKLGKYTLAHAERAGLRQADNLIFDIKRLNMQLQSKAVNEIEYEFLKRKGWKGLVIIVRPDNKCLIYKK